VHRISSKSLIFLVVFIDLLGFGIMIPMLPFYARSFGASATEVGFLMFVYSFMQIFIAPLWGRASDQYGRRPILLITIAGQCLAFAWAAFAGSYSILLLSRVFAGGFSANISTASAYMADISAPEDRAKAMGLVGAAFGLGFVFGPAIGGLLIPFGYQMPSAFAALLAFINLVGAFIFLAEPNSSEERRKANRRRFDWARFNEILADRKLFLPIFTFSLLTLAFVQLEVTFGLYVLDRFGLSERRAGLLLAFAGIVMAIVQGLIVGRASKFFGERRLITTGIILLCLGLFTMGLAPSPWVLVLALVVLAIGYSFSNPCLSALVSKSASASEQGSILGIYQSGGSVARVVGPILAGTLYDWNLRSPFWAGALITLTAVGIWIIFYRKKAGTSEV